MRSTFINCCGYGGDITQAQNRLGSIPVVEGAIITCCSNFKDAEKKTLKRV